MTLLSRLGYSPVKEEQIAVPSQINARDISIIIPVKDNQIGVNRLLEELARITQDSCTPREVIVIDNLSSVPLEIHKQYPFPVLLANCKKVGPAAARNVGVSHSTGQWLLFLDSDCVPSDTTISGYICDDNKHIGYAGDVRVSSNDRLSKYYETQEILIPPQAKITSGIRPDYLVTANCLIYRGAFELVGGFDESFSQAGGEDIDIAFKMLCFGSLEYQWKSQVYHSFEDGFSGFWKRFVRYGKGNRQLAEKYSLDLRPAPFMPEAITPVNIFLSCIQFLAMSRGYRIKHITSQSTRTQQSCASV